MIRVALRVAARHLVVLTVLHEVSWLAFGVLFFGHCGNTTRLEGALGLPLLLGFTRGLPALAVGLTVAACVRFGRCGIVKALLGGGVALAAEVLLALTWLAGGSVYDLRDLAFALAPAVIGVVAGMASAALEPLADPSSGAASE